MKKNVNILLSCAGRRNYLIHYFRQALRGRGIIIAVDCNLNAPALQEADKAFVVPPVSQPEYRRVLLDLCITNDVCLLLSLNDNELEFLAEWRLCFLQHGINIIVSDSRAIDICFDKWKSGCFLHSIGLMSPKTYLSLESAHEALYRREIAFPLVVKLRRGSGSAQMAYPNDFSELEWAYQQIRSRVSLSAGARDVDNPIVIQEYIQGEEYGLDIINDLDGNYVCTFARRKLLMRAGETDQALIVAAAPSLEQLGQRISRGLRHIGNLDCDAFLSAAEWYVIDMNPRFGGGYPFSHAAGANLPAALIAWARGEEAQSAWFKVNQGVTAVKCDRILTIAKHPEQY